MKNFLATALYLSGLFILASCEKEVSLIDTMTTSEASRSGKLASEVVIVNGREIKTRMGIIVFANKEEYGV